MDNMNKRCCFCKLIGHSVINDEIVCLEFAWPGKEPKGGQFFLIRPERTSVFLARPLSAAFWRPSALGFLVAKRGRGTHELASLQIGEMALLTGPLGRGWAEVSGDGINKGEAALVSGGVGVAPLACFAKELALEHKAFDFYAGFKSAPFGLEGILPRSLVIASEDGSSGLMGRIPDHFSPDAYSVVYACGPWPMLKLIAMKCKAARVPCFISLERHMACGTGACLGCTIKTVAGNKRCCAEGPVFDAEDIIFD